MTNLEINLLSPRGFSDYELIDAGNFEKLERFGKYFLIRPETQALWRPKLPEKEWFKLAHARFVREAQKSSYRSGDAENGGWEKLKAMPDQWNIEYKTLQKTITLKLSLTSFGHIGVFPEQAPNWDYLAQMFSKKEFQNGQLLNAFGYTGAASLVGCAFGAQVTHLDAVKQVVNWNKENMELSGLDGIRRIVDDAVKFLKREIKREKKYQGIIIDPPAYGRGPNGERWVLDEGINELLELCSQLTHEGHYFFILNLYAFGYTTLVANNLVDSYFDYTHKEIGEFYLQSNSGMPMPRGTYVRISR